MSEPEQQATIDAPRAIRVKTSTGWADLVIEGAQGNTGPAGAIGPPGPTGAAGANGATGPAGPGVPVGGASGQVLTKTSATDYATDWEAPAPATDLVYEGDFAPGSFVDGDIVVYQGVSYMCVRPTSAAPTPWPQSGALAIPQSALVPIADVKLATAQASIDLTAIPQGFAHLKLVAYVRSDQAVATGDCWMRFNGDAGPNYDLMNSGVGAVGATNQLVIGWLVGASGSPSVFANAIIDVLNYADTSSKTGFVSNSGVEGLEGSSGSYGTKINSGHWRNTAAINRITLLPTSGNFAAGTRVTLYGVLGTLQSSIAALTVPVAATTLPTTPSDGQQAILVDNTAAPTYSWLMQWSATASRWLFVGGAPFEVEVQNGVLESTTSTTYTNLTTIGPQFVVPRAGGYLISFGMLADTNGAAGGANQSWMSIKLGAAAALDADGVMTRVPDFVSIARAIKRTLNAGDTLLAQYHTVGTGTCRAQSRWMTVEPVSLT